MLLQRKKSWRLNTKRKSVQKKDVNLAQKLVENVTLMEEDGNALLKGAKQHHLTGINVVSTEVVGDVRQKIAAVSHNSKVRVINMPRKVKKINIQPLYEKGGKKI